MNTTMTRILVSALLAITINPLRAQEQELAIERLSEVAQSAQQAYAATQDSLARAERLEERLNELLRAQREEFERQLRQVPSVGSVLFMASAHEPEGYLLCDGQTLYIADHPELFDAIGVTYGGDGRVTFRLPDLRGTFPRFADAGRGLDPGRVVGSYQEEATRLPRNSFENSSAGEHSHSSSAQGGHAHETNATGEHRHNMDSGGNHRHTGENVEFDSLLRHLGGHGSTSGLDDYEHPGTREPDIQYSEKMRDAGEHTHGIHGAGNHRHSLSSVPDHSHALSASGSHTHRLSGGDSETRPKNVALFGYIKR